MRRTTIAIVALAALAAPAGAHAGGIEVVAMNRPSAQIQAGETWRAKLRVANCLGTQMEGIAPAVAIREQSTGRELRFAARRVRAGVYEARVVFPAAGSWTYSTELSDATYEIRGPVRVKRRARETSYAAAAGGGGLVLAALGGLAAVFRRRRRAPGR